MSISLRLRSFLSSNKNCSNDNNNIKKSSSSDDNELTSDEYESAFSEFENEIADVNHDKKKSPSKDTLRTCLKKLGVLDIEQALNSVESTENSRTTRSSCRGFNDQSKKTIEIIDTSGTDQSLKRKHKSIISKKTFNFDEKTKITHNKSFRKRKVEFEKLDEKSNPCANVNLHDQHELENNNNNILDDDSLEPDINNSAPLCLVSGCDSTGHLSGAFKTHATIDTCPLFHNQTAKECEIRYQKRLKNTNQSSPTKNSLSRRSTQKLKSLETNLKWKEIMNQRQIEMKKIEIDNPKILDVNSNRQPNLAGFTSNFDLELFLEAQSRTAEMIHENSSLELVFQPIESDSNSFKPKQTGVRSIIFGQYEIGVWYDSPYSDEFRNCLQLLVCEFCLKCMTSKIILKRHQNKCSIRHPPGNEIYRKENISFFEIDGQNQKEYCQNLCLLAKLFLDYKTLFFDVEPFCFYVMTENDSSGMHIIGYFSKEKYSPNHYNVSCILTLPQYQRCGYGKMLIEFSYLLTKVENKIGSPEKPLSDLGIISYRSYWKYLIMDYLSSYEGKEILLKDMSQQTGVNSADIVSTLQLMKILKYWKAKHLILMPDDLKKRFSVEVKEKSQINKNKKIDPSCLCWTPTIYPQNSK